MRIISSRILPLFDQTARSAPLYRPNLRYQVLPKASSAPTVIENMADWILRHHPGKQGIVYTLSQKVSSVE